MRYGYFTWPLLYTNLSISTNRNALITILRKIFTNLILCMHTSAFLASLPIHLFYVPTLTLHRANQTTPLEHPPQSTRIFTRGPRQSSIAVNTGKHTKQALRHLRQSLTQKSYKTFGLHQIHQDLWITCPFQFTNTQQLSYTLQLSVFTPKHPVNIF